MKYDICRFFQIYLTHYLLKNGLQKKASLIAINSKLHHSNICDKRTAISNRMQRSEDNGRSCYKSCNIPCTLMSWCLYRKEQKTPTLKDLRKFWPTFHLKGNKNLHYKFNINSFWSSKYSTFGCVNIICII